jgi:hypothetical protein
VTCGTEKGKSLDADEFDFDSDVEEPEKKKAGKSPSRQPSIVDALTPKKRVNAEDGGPTSVKKIKKESVITPVEEKRYVLVKEDEMIEEGMEIDDPVKKESPVKETRFVMIKEDEVIEEGMEIDDSSIETEKVEIKNKAPVKKKSPAKKETPVKVDL